MEPFLGPDLVLNLDDCDIVFTDGDLSLSVDVAQAVQIRLLTFLGEWFLDRARGLPYFTSIFGKPVNLPLIRSLYRNEILETPGIETVPDVTLDFDATTRNLTVTSTATQDDSEISNVVTVTL